MAKAFSSRASAALNSTPAAQNARTAHNARITGAAQPVQNRTSIPDAAKQGLQPMKLPAVKRITPGSGPKELQGRSMQPKKGA